MTVYTFLKSRNVYTVNNGTPATKRRFPNGVLQGLVLSPTLFNIFMRYISIPAHPDIHILSYADDIIIFFQHPISHTAATQLQDYLDTLEQSLHSNRMKVSPSKSTLTLITTHAYEYNLKPIIKLNNISIPYSDTPTTLRVTYDKKMRFTSHTENINTRAKTRLNVLRALTNTTSGQSKEDIILVYNQYI